MKGWITGRVMIYRPSNRDGLVNEKTIAAIVRPASAIATEFIFAPRVA